MPRVPARLTALDIAALSVGGRNLLGSVRRLPIPSDEQLAEGMREVAGFGAPYGHAAPPLDAILHPGGPIEHVIYAIEAIFGMPPLTPYDAGARPLSDAFTATPDLRPFAARPETVDTGATNAKTAYRATDSARLNFAIEDAAPDGELNDILWHAVRGAAAADPPSGDFR